MTSGATERSVLLERLQHVRLDLEELGEQVASGEIDPATGSRLRSAYETELAEVEEALAAAPGDETGEPGESVPRSYRRAVVGTAVLLAAFTAAILFISGDTVPTQQGAAAGVDSTPRDLPQGQGTLDAMERAVATDPDNIPLRMGIADAYFQRAEYSPALGHYLEVLEADPPPSLQSIALGRVGWMAFITGQFDAADEYLRRSLEANDANVEGTLFLGYVRLFGFDDPEGAIPLLEQVLAAPDLAADLRSEISATLETARARLVAP